MNNPKILAKNQLQKPVLQLNGYKIFKSRAKRLKAQNIRLNKFQPNLKINTKILPQKQSLKSIQNNRKIFKLPKIQII